MRQRQSDEDTRLLATPAPTTTDLIVEQKKQKGSSQLSHARMHAAHACRSQYVQTPPLRTLLRGHTRKGHT